MRSGKKRLVACTGVRYKNYVLVLGESVRRDYLHAYGFATYWLSNQSFAGEFDTPITAVSALADIRPFVVGR